MAGSITINGSSTDLGGTRTLNQITIAGGATIDETLTSTLASGDNVFLVPAGAVGAVIIPPTGTAVTLKIRTNTNSGDAGLSISNLYPSVYAFPTTAPTSITINSSAAVTTSNIEIWYW